jgi:RHH-type proline utilization regulon transcriptional repressor/proline dehydrogenase/delta 1-pyrroline-5-carboxylate dehydrogenase
MGVNLANDAELAALSAKVNAAIKPWTATPLVPGATPTGT